MRKQIFFFGLFALCLASGVHAQQPRQLAAPRGIVLHTTDGREPTLLRTSSGRTLIVNPPMRAIVLKPFSLHPSFISQYVGLTAGSISDLAYFAAGLCGTNQILEDQGASWACIATPAGGATVWSGIGNPTGNLTLTMVTNTTTFNSGTFGAAAPTPWNWTGTWNDAGTTFVFADTNITDTASAAGSLLRRWRVGAVMQAQLLKSGVFDVATGYRIGGAAAAAAYLRGNGTNFVSSAIQVGDLPAGAINNLNLLAAALCGTNEILEDQGASWACIATPAGGATVWSGIGNPTGNQALTMAAFTSTWTWNATTGAGNLLTLTDTINNTGTGYLSTVNTASGSAAKVWRICYRGTTDCITFDAGELATTGTAVIAPAAGTLSAPTIKMDTQTGFYRHSASQIGVSAGNSLAARFGSTGMSLPSGDSLFWCNDATCSAAVDLGINRTSAAVARVTDGAAARGALEMLRSDVALGTITTDIQAANITVTLNAAGVDFKVRKATVTNTASGASTCLDSWTVGATEVYCLRTSGQIDLAGTSTGTIASIVAAAMSTAGAGRSSIGFNTGHVASVSENNGTVTPIIIGTRANFPNAAPVRGSIFCANVTPAWAALAIGAANRVLFSDGTDCSWAQVPLATAVSGILPGANGGTGNGFFAVSGPATSLKTFTFPNASAAMLTDNAAVTVAQGGTGIASGTSGGIPYFSASTTIASSAALGANLPVFGGGAGVAPFTGTRTGNTTQVATWTGATTADRCVNTDASGNLRVTGADCGTGAGGNNAALFTATADATVSNSASEATIVGTGVGSKTTTANYFAAGTSLLVRSSGYFSTPAVPDTITIRIKAGTTAVGAVTFTLPAALTNQAFKIEGLITCRTAGATGTFMLNDIVLSTNSTLTATVSAELLNTTTVTLDTTGTLAWDVTVQWGAAQAGETITGTNFVMLTPGTGIADPGANGILARTALNTVSARTITGTTNEVVVTNGDGVSGNPTLSLDADIGALGANGTNGFWARTGAGTGAARTFQNESLSFFTWTNPAGTAGDPTPAFAAKARTGNIDVTIDAPTTADTNKVQWYLPSASTITRVVCSVGAATSVTIQLDERAEATPNTAGTNVMTASLVCDTTNGGITTSFTNATIAARVPLNLQVTATAGTPGSVRVHIEYTID